MTVTVMPALDRIIDALHGFERGVFQFNNPVSASDLCALQSRLPLALPEVWSALLSQFDGFDLRADRYFGAAECLARWARWRRDEQPRYSVLPGWSGAPPETLLPVATDLEGNLKCIDLETHLVWDWHAESGRLTLWFTRPEHLILVGVQTLALRFDSAGRPKAMSARRQASLLREELLVHVGFEPECPYAQLELGRWLERHGTPEDAMACYRRASASRVEMAVAHFELGRFCILTGHHATARRALRRALAAPANTNPMKHRLPQGVRVAIHQYLERLYIRVGQGALSDTHKHAAAQALKTEGSGWYGETEAFRQVMNVLG